ncbi:cell division protein ZapA [Spongiibacter marinus]|uniref:cell division protein ZapA n=1 Tax=Spongiibacter marinus TaxID=354246 RepID=UPI00041106C8|nr:cell division protein ZapA [Spongiibacter marinus]
MSKETVIVKILDKEYQVACPSDEQTGLLEAARYLDQQMRQIRNSGKIIGLERIAVMAALNIAYELREASKSGVSTEQEATVSKRITDKIDDTLNCCRQLDIG